jgi:hypothetical protein
VGINAAADRDCVEVSPFVGVHAVSIEKLWTRLKRGEYPGRYDRGVATYALHLGELVPNVRAFHFVDETDVDLETERLAALYHGVGVSFAQSISSYERLLPLIEGRVEWLGGYPERVACCLYLMGRISDAREFTERFLQTERDYFEGFALPFIQTIDDGQAQSRTRD